MINHYECISSCFIPLSERHSLPWYSDTVWGKLPGFVAGGRIGSDRPAFHDARLLSKKENTSPFTAGVTSECFPFDVERSDPGVDASGVRNRTYRADVRGHTTLHSTEETLTPY